MPSMYQEQIIDHYKYPRNFEEMEDATFDYGDTNPVCGDEIHLYVRLDDDEKVEKVSFQGDGCAISMASASMLTSLLEGMDIDEVEELTNEDIKEMLGIRLSPTRLKCAILSLKVLEGGMIKYHGGEVGSSIEED